MFKGIESVLINSAKAKELASFYKEKVGLPLTLEAEMEGGKDIYGFEMKEGADLYIQESSQFSRSATDPDRVIFSLEVEDIKKGVETLEKAGVEKLHDYFHLEGYGYIATFKDLDGNTFRIVQVRD